MFEEGDYQSKSLSRDHRVIMYEPQANSITQLKSIRQKQIFNRLNALHYQGIPLIACLQHKNHERCIYLKAHPEPVANEKVTATWIQNEIFPPNLSSFDLVKKGEDIVDVKIRYEDDYTRQMLNYSENYSFLPITK